MLLMDDLAEVILPASVNMEQIERLHAMCPNELEIIPSENEIVRLKFPVSWLEIKPK